MRRKRERYPTISRFKVLVADELAGIQDFCLSGGPRLKSLLADWSVGRKIFDGVIVEDIFVEFTTTPRAAELIVRGTVQSEYTKQLFYCHTERRVVCRLKYNTALRYARMHLMYMAEGV